MGDNRQQTWGFPGLPVETWVHTRNDWLDAARLQLSKHLGSGLIAVEWTSISPWEDVFSSPIFSLRGQFPNWAVLMCLAPSRRLNICDLKPWKSGGDCRSEGIFFLQKWWNTCDICDIWDSLSSAPNPSSWHGVLRVLLPWFHTRDQEQNATMGPSDCQPSSFGILVTLVVVWKSSTLKLDGGQDLWVWVPWLVTKFNVISVTSTYFFIPSIGTSDFRMAQFPPVVWGLTLW